LPEIRKRDGFKNERHIKFPVKNFPTYLKNPLVNGTYVSELGYYPKASYHYRERLDGTDENILFFCLEGKGTVKLQEPSGMLTINIGQNDLFCIPKKIPHIYFTDEKSPWTILWIHFDSSITGNLPILQLQKVNVNDPHKKGIIENCLIDLFSMESKNLTLSNAILMASLINHLLIITYLFEETEIAEKKSHILTNCIQYMSSNLHSDLMLSDLTNKFNISSSYLNTIFKSETSKSPIEFFIKLKMDEACNLLRITKMKISDIAANLGYSDSYYFSRLFKKNMGVSPQKYRDQFRTKKVNIPFLFDRNSTDKKN
jgi:AraC family transcriptional regulator, arabinose operon regulatory protein